MMQKLIMDMENVNIDRNETTPFFDYNARNDIKKMYK